MGNLGPSRSLVCVSVGHYTNHQNVEGKITRKLVSLLLEMKWSCIHIWSNKHVCMLSTSGWISSRSMTNRSTISISCNSSCVYSGTGMSVPSGTSDECEGPGRHGETCGRGFVLPDESLLPRLGLPASTGILGLPTSSGINDSTSGMDGPPRWGTNGIWFRISSIVSNPINRKWTKQIWDMCSWKIENSTLLQNENSKQYIPTNRHQMKYETNMFHAKWTVTPREACTCVNVWAWDCFRINPETQMSVEQSAPRQSWDHFVQHEGGVLCEPVLQLTRVSEFEGR